MAQGDVPLPAEGAPGRATVLPIRRTRMNWFTALSTRLFRPKPRTAEQRARDLLRAVDAGGLPLNVAVVNHIARELGLDVSRKARMPETIERIRKVMAGR